MAAATSHFSPVTPGSYADSTSDTIAPSSAHHAPLPSSLGVTFSWITWNMKLCSPSDTDSKHPLYHVDMRFLKDPPILVRAPLLPASTGHSATTIVGKGRMHPVSIHAGFELVNRSPRGQEISYDTAGSRGFSGRRGKLKALSHIRSRYGYLSYNFGALAGGSHADYGKKFADYEEEDNSDYGEAENGSPSSRDNEKEYFQARSREAVKGQQHPAYATGESSSGSKSIQPAPMCWQGHVSIKTWEFVLLHAPTQEAVAKMTVNIWGVTNGGKLEFVPLEKLSFMRDALASGISHETRQRLQDEIVTTGVTTYLTIMYRQINILNIGGMVFNRTGLDREKMIEEKKEAERKEIEQERRAREERERERMRVGGGLA